MNKERANFIGRVAAAKKGAEAGLQGFGRRIRKNIDQGQEDLRTGKMKHYGSINPFK